MEKELSFEEKINNLEKIVKELENGDVALDDAINKFNEAIKLYKKPTKMVGLLINRLFEHLRFFQPLIVKSRTTKAQRISQQMLKKPFLRK